MKAALILGACVIMLVGTFVSVLAYSAGIGGWLSAGIVLVVGFGLAAVLDWRDARAQRNQENKP